MQAQAVTRRGFLQKTATIAQLFKKLSSTVNPSLVTVCNVPPPSPPTLYLEIPAHIQSEIDEPGLPVDLRDALVSTITDLKADYVHAFNQAYRKISLSPSSHFAVQRLADVLRQRFLQQALPGIMAHHREAKASLARAQSTEVEESKRKFNNAYIPYLQAYFAYNAYPSLHDREVMARKSMMTSRQIEVWFQNHRRVEKKAGRPWVKRKASDAGPSQSQIDKIEQALGVFGVPKEERTLSEKEREELGYVRGERVRGFSTLSAPRYPRDATPIDVLALPPRPIPDAVPGYTPFLSGTMPQCHFPPPTWTRRPATQPLPHPPQRPSFSELSEMFATKLRTYSDILRVSEESVPPAATCAITTRLEVGHHPALVNTPERRRKEAMLPRRPRPTRSRSPSLHRQVSWSSSSSGSEESLPATPQSTHVELEPEPEPEPFDDLFDEPEHVHEVPLDIQGFVYADYPTPVIAVGGRKKNKSHYRT